MECDVHKCYCLPWLVCKVIKHKHKIGQCERKILFSFFPWDLGRCKLASLVTTVKIIRRQCAIYTNAGAGHISSTVEVPGTLRQQTLGEGWVGRGNLTARLVLLCWFPPLFFMIWFQTLKCMTSTEPGGMIMNDIFFYFLKENGVFVQHP